MEDMMRISELAAATGETVKTLRYWHDEGLLDAQRSPNGYRAFPHAMIERVHFLRDAQALGLTLREIRDVLHLRQEGRRPCEHVRHRLRTHLTTVRERLAHLHALERDLERRLTWANAHPEIECDDGCVYLTVTSTPADTRS